LVARSLAMPPGHAIETRGIGGNDTHTLRLGQLDQIARTAILPSGG